MTDKLKVGWKYSITISKNCTAIHKVDNNLILTQPEFFDCLFLSFWNNKVHCILMWKCFPFISFHVHEYILNTYIVHVHVPCKFKKSKKKKNIDLITATLYDLFFMDACTTTFTVPVSASRTKAIKHGSCLQHFQICA